MRLKISIAASLIALSTGFALPAAQAADAKIAPKGAKFSEDTYKYLALFGAAFERVRKDYVEDVSDQQLLENASNGMLTGLDPHSGYMPAKNFQDMQEQTKGEF